MGWSAVKSWNSLEVERSSWLALKPRKPAAPSRSNRNTYLPLMMSGFITLPKNASVLRSSDGSSGTAHSVQHLQNWQQSELLTTYLRGG